MPSDTLFGLGEREDTLVLKRTSKRSPYELWAKDHPHKPNKKTGLYGNMPYVQGIGQDSTQGVMWVNSAHTNVFLEDAAFKNVTGSNIHFVSESGALELFLFSSVAPLRNKRMSYDVSTITGFAPLPPLHTLGFHFSKWDGVSAEIIMERNKNFTDFNFPVDVLVMDIEWAMQNNKARDYQYFKFNPANFTADQIEKMNS